MTPHHITFFTSITPHNTRTHTHTGHLVCYRPPWVFKTVYEAMKRFVDPRTTSKVIFLYGDDSDGSPNDLQMKKVIG
jgi:hypothetical protein